MHVLGINYDIHASGRSIDDERNVGGGKVQHRILGSSPCPFVPVRMAHLHLGFVDGRERKLGPIEQKVSKKETGVRSPLGIERSYTSFSTMKTCARISKNRRSVKFYRQKNQIRKETTSATDESSSPRVNKILSALDFSSTVNLTNRE